MTENENITSRIRWNKFKEMIKKELPEYQKDYIDEGRENKYWKVRFTRKVEQVTYTIIVKIRNNVMTTPTLDYESCFSSGIEKIKNVFISRRENQGFLGTVIIGESDNEPSILYKEGEKSSDDEW